MKQIWNFISLAFSAIILAFAASKAAGARQQARRLEKKAEGLLNTQVSKDIHKGKKLTEKANRAKDRASDARMRIEGQLDKLGEKNEELDVIVDRFNSRRVRK